MGRNGPLGSFRALDAFARPLEDVRIRSSSGAILTLFSALIIFSLTVSSWADYQRINLDHSLEVDQSRGEKLVVNVDIEFPRVPCYLLSIDVMDISGEHLDDIKHDIKRHRLDHDGGIVRDAMGGLKGEADRLAAQKASNFCGSCYGGETPKENAGCCQTCEDVREAYSRKGWSFEDPDHIDQCIQEGWTEKIKAQNKEGCRVIGQLHINKVVGNFHLSPGRSFSRNDLHMHDVVHYLKDSEANRHDFGHIIHTFSFGAEDEFTDLTSDGIQRKFGSLATSGPLKAKLDIKEPLADHKSEMLTSSTMYQYFTKVVATEYRPLKGKPMSTFQYSATSYQRDLSPGSNMVQAKPGGDTAATHAPHQIQHGFQGIPGVFFNYEISPLRTVHTEWRLPFSRFLSSLCSIVGGVLTLAGLLDALIWHYRVRLSAGGHGVGSHGMTGGGGGGGGGGGYGMTARGGKLI